MEAEIKTGDLYISSETRKEKKIRIAQEKVACREHYLYNIALEDLERQRSLIEAYEKIDYELFQDEIDERARIDMYLNKGEDVLLQLKLRK